MSGVPLLSTYQGEGEEEKGDQHLYAITHKVRPERVHNRPSSFPPPPPSSSLPLSTMSLLLIHRRTTDPTPFLRALPVHNSTWEINNKYYTARVNVLVHPLDEPPRGQAEAVIYLYDSVSLVPFLFRTFLIDHRTQHRRKNSPTTSSQRTQNSASPSVSLPPLATRIPTTQKRKKTHGTSMASNTSTFRVSVTPRMPMGRCRA